MYRRLAIQKTLANYSFEATQCLTQATAAIIDCGGQLTIAGSGKAPISRDGGCITERGWVARVPMGTSRSATFRS
jgi:hypothetical protein